MARCSLHVPSTKTRALAALATSMLVALFANRKGPDLAISSGSDFMVMMQSKPLLETEEFGEDQLRTSNYEKQIETLSKDAGLPYVPKTTTGEQSSYASLVATRIREAMASIRASSQSALASVSLLAKRAMASVSLLAKRAGIKRMTSGNSPMIIVMVIACALFICLLLSFFGWSFNKSGQQNDAKGDYGSPSSQRTSRRSSFNLFSSPGSTRDIGGGAFDTKEMPPTSGSFLPDPRMIPSTGQSRGAMSAVPSSCATSMTDIGRASVRPPPLCPTLVMPMSEALLGNQMYELAQMSTEGALNIVGISGKPLLRAEVKRVGNCRSLEISMPEPNSIPRATIAPPVDASGALAGRALEIRGMRGVFYGSLQMQSSGACYVVKDGQTVLTIDGDAESLQLALKSATGMQLASVKCSTEQFEGVDHVELRVEPGVDTVLVIAVVLAVLLLSPYLPPED